MAALNSFTMKLQVVPMPVTDIDRAKVFYVEQVGFHLDHDVKPSEVVRAMEMGEVIEYPGGIKYSGFSDPDGNSWTLQEVPPGL